MGVVGYTSYSRSVPMSREEAEAVAARSELFGYKPLMRLYRGHWHLDLCSPGDHRAAEAELARLRGATA